MMTATPQNLHLWPIFPASSVRRLEAGVEGPPMDVLLVEQPLIDIERAAGEGSTWPLLANPRGNQFV